MSGRLAVFGGGGHGKVVVATAQAAGWRVEAVFDEAARPTDSEVLGVPVSSPPAAAGDRTLVLAIGDNRTRQRLASREGERWGTVVHPRAEVHSTATLGEGTVVFAGAVVQPGARIGRHVIINTGALVDHDTELGDFVHVAPGAALGGGVWVGEGALLGIGCRLLPGARVGRWATVGAGAVVNRLVPDGATVAGVPARPLDNA